MSSAEIIRLLAYGVGGFMVIPAACWLLRLMFISVEDESSVLITEFGKVREVLKEPGLHAFPRRLLPWTKVVPVSCKLDYRRYESLHLNDSRGTTVVVDLWVELRISAPEQALYQVESWEQSLQSLLTSSASSILGTQEFDQILRNRSDLGKDIRAAVKTETARWGLAVEQVFISRLSLLPDVAQQFFDTVAAKLERAKSDIEEAGRLKAALLEADTSAKIAALVAEAKGQYSLAVGRAFHRLAPNPELLEAYNELYELSMVKPHRTVAFHGFAAGDLPAAEAAMMVPPLEHGGIGASASAPDHYAFAHQLTDADGHHERGVVKGR